MVRWRLSIAVPHTCRLELARHRLMPVRTALSALTALGLTLLLGRTGAPLPLFRGAPVELSGLVTVAGLGLLAWHFARLTALPLAESPAAALVAALIPALFFPELGKIALLVPAAAAIWLWRGRHDQRVVALMVQCGALAGLTARPDGDFSSAFLYATMLGTALFLTARTLSGAANDNPSMERVGQIQRLPRPLRYARADSYPGKWGVS